MKRNKRFLSMFFVFIFLSSLAVILAGCGGGGGESATATTATTLSGTAATGKAMASAVITVKDSTGATKTGSSGTDGKYSIDVKGMTPPFLLRATIDATALYSAAASAGIVNIHPFTDLIVRNWYIEQGTDVGAVFNDSGPLTNAPTATELVTMQNVIKSILATQLKLAMNSSTFNMFNAAFNADGKGFDAILDKTKVSMAGTDSTITVDLKDPSSNVIMGNILTMPAGTDISTIDAAMAGVNSGVASLQATINTDPCNLKSTDIQPYFATNFMTHGLDIDQLAAEFKSMACPNGSKGTIALSADYISYNSVTGTLKIKLMIKAGTQQEGSAINFRKDMTTGNWIAMSDGLPADIIVRSRVEDHIRAASSTNKPKGFIDGRQIKVRVYSNTITNVKVTGPNSFASPVDIVCNDFTTSGDCDAKGYGQDFPVKVFEFDDTSLIKGDYKVFTSADGGKTWSSSYTKSIIGTPGLDHTVVADFPMFSGISTHSISSVLGTTITASVYTPSWVSEIAPPFVSLADGSGNYLGEAEVTWIGIPKVGQYNQFTVTIPSTYHNNTAVASAVLGQDAQSEVFEGWGQTAVYWYFE